MDFWHGVQRRVIGQQPSIQKAAHWSEVCGGSAAGAGSSPHNLFWCKDRDIKILKRHATINHKLWFWVQQFKTPICRESLLAFTKHSHSSTLKRTKCWNLAVLLRVSMNFVWNHIQSKKFDILGNTIFTFLLTVRWEEWYDSHVCTVSMKLPTAVSSRLT